MTDITIRRVRPTDADALVAFYGTLSKESRRARFLAFGSTISGKSARSLCSLDHMHDEGFVALASTNDVPAAIIGHVCLAEWGQGAVELGIAVADGYQGRGVGRRLFVEAIAWAHDRGYERVNATCFADNTRVLKLLRSSPVQPMIEYSGDGVVDVSIPLRAPLPSAVTDYSVGTGRSSRRRRARRPYSHARNTTITHCWRLPRPA